MITLSGGPMPILVQAPAAATPAASTAVAMVQPSQPVPPVIAQQSSAQPDDATHDHDGQGRRQKKPAPVWDAANAQDEQNAAGPELGQLVDREI